MKALVIITSSARHNQLESHWLRLVALFRNESGISAIEFALFAPILLIGFLSMIDIGFAAYQRMTMEHVLRAGAQSAMTDPGTANVIKVLESTASENFSSGGSTPTGGKQPISLSAKRYCVCPVNIHIEVACSTICQVANKPAPTRAYYLLSASQTYSAMFLPDFNFNPKLQVQVR